MERKPIRPETVIDDLYNNQMNSLMDELHKKISLKDYDHNENWTYIIVHIRKEVEYNLVVLNEVKRRYLEDGWGNIFYNVLKDEITFQLYFPQKSTIL